MGLVLLHTILLYIANVLARTTSYTLFVNNFGADNLPYIYIGIGLLGSIISYVYLQLGERLPLTHLLLGNFVSILISFILIWLGLTSAQNTTIVFILPIWFGVVYALNITGFWSLVGRMFTLRQGKRLFGLLGSGEHIAMGSARVVKNICKGSRLSNAVPDGLCQWARRRHDHD